jgi:hypothetical protein
VGPGVILHGLGLLFGGEGVLESEEVSGLLRSGLVDNVNGSHGAESHESIAVELVGEGEDLEEEVVAGSMDVTVRHGLDEGPPVRLVLVTLGLLFLHHHLEMLLVLSLLEWGRAVGVETTVLGDDFEVLHSLNDGGDFVVFTSGDVVGEVGELGVLTGDEIVDVSSGDLSGLLLSFGGFFAGFLFLDLLGLLESQPGEGGEDFSSVLAGDLDVSAFIISSAETGSEVFSELVGFDHSV